MLIDYEKLTAISTGILHAAGAPEDHARLVSEHLVEANLKGHDSHGVQMVQSYVQAIMAGLIAPDQHAELVADNGALLSFDGCRGLGRIVGMEAIEKGIERTGSTGICCVALGNAAHLGRIGLFGERCAEDGYISMHYVNVVGHGPIAVAFGGRDRRFVTNPFCCTVPRPDGNHVVLDMATTTVAAGKVKVAMMKGLQVPDDSLVDAQGVPTNDPGALFGTGGGAMQPFGKHKGYGLMVMCELLGGALGGLFTMQPGNEREGATINNMLSIILDPKGLGARETFDEEATAMLNYIYDSKPAEGVDAVLVPGDPERRSKAQRLAGGIDVDENTWVEFTKAGESAGFGPDKVGAILEE